MRVVDATPSDSAASPQHPGHAQWAKQTLIEDEAKLISSQGKIPDMRRIEREWVESLCRVERRAELMKHRPRPKPQPKAKDPAAEVAHDLGYQLHRHRELAKRLAREKRIARAVMRTDSEFRALFARMQVILNRCRLGDPEFQGLGAQVARSFTQNKRRKGAFAEVSAEQRDKELRRQLVRIADRSADTTALGKWH